MQDVLSFRQSFSRTNHRTANAVKSEALHKLEPRVADQLKILEVHYKSFVLHYNGIPEKISINNAPHTPTTKLSAPTPEILQRCRKPLRQQPHNSVQERIEYIVDHIVRHPE